MSEQSPPITASDEATVFKREISPTTRWIMGGALAVFLLLMAYYTADAVDAHDDSEVAHSQQIRTSLDTHNAGEFSHPNIQKDFKKAFDAYRETETADRKKSNEQMLEAIRAMN